MNKEIIEKELENIYRRTMDKDINNSLIKIKKALKIKEEEVLKKIGKLKEEILKMQKQDFYESPFTLIFQKIDKIFEEELKKEIKNE